MKYENIVEAEFISRPNRFIAIVRLNGEEIKAHVPNTGRCKELLIPGVKVILSRSDNPNRKLSYSLISVYKGDMLVNIDSQNPNRLVYEALSTGKLFGKIPDKIKKEYTFGSSRIDLMFEDAVLGKGLIEVKGCTLEIDGHTFFPDAPTERGVKHLKELIEAKKDGWNCYVVFAIQMKGVRAFSPNRNTHGEFADVLADADKAGVKILAFDSIVSTDEVVLDSEVEVILI